MRVLMLGTGAALIDPDRNHSSILITVRGENYLFDCGHNATRSMVANGVDPTTVRAIFLSHLHFDHIADFSYHMISTWMAGRKAPPTVVGPRDTQAFVDHSLADGAYAKDIEARVQYKQRQDNFDVLRPPVIEAEPGLVYEDDLVRVTACHVEHIPLEISPCFGLRLDTVDGESVVFSGDTAPCDRLIDLAEGCDRDDRPKDLAPHDLVRLPRAGDHRRPVVEAAVAHHLASGGDSYMALLARTLHE